MNHTCINLVQFMFVIEFDEYSLRSWWVGGFVMMTQLLKEKKDTEEEES